MCQKDQSLIQSEKAVTEKKKSTKATVYYLNTVAFCCDYRSHGLREGYG